MRVSKAMHGLRIAGVGDPIHRVSAPLATKGRR